MSDLRDTYVIARRELLERVKSKWFVAMTLLAPIGIVAIVLVPALIAGGAEGAKVEIVDKTGVIAQPLYDKLVAIQWKPAIIAADTPDQVEMDRIRDKKINGFVSIPTDGLEGGLIRYRGDNASSQVVQAKLRFVVSSVVQLERGRRAGIAEDKLAKLLEPPAFDPQQTSGEAEGASGVAYFLIGYALAYVLFLVITLYGVAVMRSVVQEKTSRVMELMVATVKPRSLMTGKIIGVGTAGLIQVAVWLTMGALTLAYRDQLLGLFGARGGGGSALPSLGLVDIAVALAFFVLGYFFYAAMYAAVGAMVSSDQDTQQVQMPITILLVVGFASVTVVSGDPRGLGAVVMTMVPLWSGLLMPMRYFIGGATPAEVVISLAILLVSTVLIARAAAKIYRVGVLMYGKRPGLKELVRWLRY